MVLPRSFRPLVSAAAAVGVALLAGPAPNGAFAASVRDSAAITPNQGSPASALASGAPASFAWHITPTGSAEEFRGLAAVSRRVAWVSGEDGSVLRTTTRGARWKDVSPPRAAGLALRDIEAWNRRSAVVLSIGPGTDSRIYSTNDGGVTWRERFRNHSLKAFYDCMAFSAAGRGLALSDPVHRHFRLAVSNDFGRTWHVRGTRGMPVARDGEFAFAASGTCVVPVRKRSFAFITGGVDVSRIFRSHDGGRTWTATETPLRGGPSAGNYSVDFRTPTRAVVVGGDFTRERDGRAAAAYLHHSRRDWTLSSRSVHGYRSGVSFISGTRSTVIAVGPSGSDASRNGGRTWSRFDGRRYDAVQCARAGACWASGTDGRVARLTRH